MLNHTAEQQFTQVIGGLGEEESGLVAAGVLVGAGGDAALLLEPVEQRSMTLRLLLLSRSPVGGRPLRDLRWARSACWSFFSGVVCAVLRARSAARVKGWQ